MDDNDSKPCNEVSVVKEPSNFEFILKLPLILFKEDNPSKDDNVFKPSKALISKSPFIKVNFSSPLNDVNESIGRDANSD